MIKLHKKDGRTVVAVCDSDLAGRKFTEGERQLDLSSDFYRGEEKDDLEAGDLIRNADIVCLAGPKSIELGRQEGVVDENSIQTVEGIPHVQAVIITE